MNAVDQTKAVYLAESMVEHSLGPRLGNWNDVETFVDAVLNDEFTRDQFSTLPSGITLEHRVRSTTSLAEAATATVWIAGPPFIALVVCHELAHLVQPTRQDHSMRFVGTELWLVRRHFSWNDYLLLKAAFDEHKVQYLEPSWQL